MGVAGAIVAPGIVCRASAQMAYAADRQGDAVSAAQLSAMADAAAGIPPAMTVQRHLRLTRPRPIDDDQPLSVDGDLKGRRA